MTRTGPSYQGRPLPRPDEEVVDQGLAFDLGTLVSRGHLSRRQMLRGLGIGAAAVGLAACSGGRSSSSTTANGSASTSAGATAAAASAEIPGETAGPYPGDGSNGPNVLSEEGVVRSDIRSSFGTSTTTAEGVPMTLTLNVVDMAEGDIAFEGAAVYVWHCNRDGEYSLYASGLEDENYLRGVQVVDADGDVTFTSVFPACYSGRWPHIHFEVYPDVDSITDAANVVATSQVALPEDVCNAVYATSGYEASVSNMSQVTLATDNVFSDDGGASQTPTATGDVTAGYALTLKVGVDTSTEPTGGSAPSGGGGGVGGGPGGGGGTPPTDVPTDAPVGTAAA